MPEPSNATRELHVRLAESPIEPKRVAELLDGLPHTQRLGAVRSLGRRQQRALYEAVVGFRPLRLTDLVPPRVDTVRHYGRNTLPAFTRFEKRFARPPGADPAQPGELYGYNFQTLQLLTGPGYFVASEDPDRPEVWIDYRSVPPTAPVSDWPPVRRNDRGLSRFVYGYMLDTLRGVSEHVSIGSAARKGRDLGSWFVLCREP